jgi:5-methyltetrahydrofolate--homocysteine methyltransferase
MMADFLETLRRRVLVYDGAMGTNIQFRNLTAGDYWGKEGCNELLVLSRPDVIGDIHSDFLAAGCDVVETDTFGSSRIVLAEYGLADRVVELNAAAVKIAREAAERHSTPEKPRFVAGSIGPTTKLPSLGHISFDEMEAAYAEQIEALIAASVDVLMIETCQDILQTKIALAAAFEARRKLDSHVPVQVSLTLEAGGAMLLGTEIGAAVTILDAFDIDILGINCATGPAEMYDAVRYLCENSTKIIAVLPNAGLPQNEGGHAVYKLTPAEMAAHHQKFVTEFGVGIVGGCCGTTPEHLKAVAGAVGGLKPLPREVKAIGAAASAYASVPFEQNPKPLIVAEEMNTTTQRKGFRDLVHAGDYDAILALAKRLANDGSHMIDLCCAIVGEDETGYMTGILEAIATRVPAPLLIDSTEASVIEAALKRIPGKPVINSINLEDGEKRSGVVLRLAKRYGASVVALTIDEQGMALTADTKVAIAHRIHDLAVNKYGLRPQDLIFDALTLPVSTGQEDYRTAAVETMEAVRRIKAELPEVSTILGVSNVSFGLNAYARRVLNSVFLHECVENGLDMAIVNFGKIYPLYKIPEAEVALARKLLFADKADGDPLQNFIAHFEAMKGKKEVVETAEVANLIIEDKLKHCIIQGQKALGEGEQKQTIEELLDVALQQYTPLELINTVLLDGMKTVGDLFGARKMQLPSVLDSAGVMKAAVSYLEPKMPKGGETQKGTMVLATVKGDVHDIGKNLVDIILSNNGFKVVNLGIKQPAEAIIAAAVEHKADAIGLSGLLVKSTLEMKYVIEGLERQGLATPVICGGAALTRKYVEDDLRRVFAGPVFYGEDAFAGLRDMERLCGSQKEATIAEGSTAKEFRKREIAEASAVQAPRDPIPPAEIPQPPFWGRKVLDAASFDLQEIFAFISEIALFKNQWQLKSASQEDYLRIVEQKYRPLFETLKQEVAAAGWFTPKAVYGYYPAQSEGNDLILYEATEGLRAGEAAPQGLKEVQRFTFPRQREGRRLSISDYILPKSSGRIDAVGLSCVTIGAQASVETQHLFERGEYTRYLYLHGLSVETAEALAELLHKRIRQELGIGGEDAERISDLFHQKYRGSRYSFGYPACPHLEDQKKLFALLRPEEAIGVRLTSAYLLEPEQSTSAIVIHHPAAKYFVV